MSDTSAGDRFFMRAALAEAKQAAAEGEVPVGAVAVRDGKIIATARNRVEATGSATAHAEFELLRAAETAIGGRRMDEVDFYVTKEPCPMCAGMLVNARVRRVVFGAGDPHGGGCGGALDITGHPGMLWHVAVTGGVLADECRSLLEAFFREMRRKKAPLPGNIRMRNFQRGAYCIELGKLLRETFDRDLSQWFGWKAWDKRFESYSIARPNSELAAHAGVFRMQLRIDGEIYPAIELACVASARADRGRGLIRKLLKAVLERYTDTPALLTAPPDVADLFLEFGFRPIRDQLPTLKIELNNPAFPRKLSPDDARPLLENNRCRSAVFDVEEAPPLALLSLCGDWAEHLLLLRDGLAAACFRDGETLHLAALFGPKPGSWREVASLLPFSGIRRVEFGFTPDALDIPLHWEEYDPPRRLLLRGSLPLPETFRFPEFLDFRPRPLHFRKKGLY